MASKDSLLLLLTDKWNRNITIKTFREKSDMRSTYVRIFLPHGFLDFQNVRFQLACTYYLFLDGAGGTLGGWTGQHCLGVKILIA